jgi:hypothetical protein
MGAMDPRAAAIRDPWPEHIHRAGFNSSDTVTTR